MCVALNHNSSWSYQWKSVSGNLPGEVFPVFYCSDAGTYYCTVQSSEHIDVGIFDIGGKCAQSFQAVRLVRAARYAHVQYTSVYSVYVLCIYKVTLRMVWELYTVLGTCCFEANA